MKSSSKKKEKHSDRKSSRPDSFLWRFARSEGLIVAAAILCDFNSWGHQFVMDDLNLIVNNPIIQSPQRLLQIFTSPFQHFSATSGDLYRPVTALSLAFNYWISGPSPDGFHFFNRLLHVLICLGIYWTIRTLIPKPPLTALFTSLLFAVHPVQTEAITYVTGRSDALAMFFFVMAWLLFIQHRQSSSPGLKTYIFSLFFYFLSLLSKENAITWLGVVLLTEFVYFSDGKFKNFAGHLRKDFFLLYAGYLMTTLLFLTTRFVALRGTVQASIGFIENPLAFATFRERFLTALKIFFQSISLMVWPAHFSPDYSYNQIPIISNWNSTAAVVVLLLTAVLTAVLVWSYRVAPSVFFGLAFFVITYSIVSNIVIPIGTIHGDRLLYLPALGLCLLAGMALAKIKEVEKGFVGSELVNGGVVLVLGLLAGRTIVRNADWRDQFTLYLKAFQTSPRSVKVNNYLGTEYVARHQLDEGLKHYRIAESIDPKFPELLSNMGLLFFQQGNAERAIQYFRRALELHPHNTEVIHINLGMALKARGDFAGAIEQYDMVIRENAKNAAAHFNKGNALYAQGKINEASHEYLQALEVDPGFTPARTNYDALQQKLRARQSQSDSK